LRRLDLLRVFDLFEDLIATLKVGHDMFLNLAVQARFLIGLLYIGGSVILLRYFIFVRVAIIARLLRLKHFPLGPLVVIIH